MTMPDIETAELTIDVGELKQRMRDELRMTDEEIQRAIEFADRARAPLDEFVSTLIRNRAGGD